MTTRLREAREAMGISQAELAGRAGVKRGVIQVWEAQTHVPRTDHAMRVAEVMGLGLEDLFHDFGIRRVPRPGGGRVIA